MNKSLQYIYQVANGDIKDPGIEITVEEVSKTVKGGFARAFAVGFLAGVKTQKDGFTLDNKTLKTPKQKDSE